MNLEHLFNDVTKYFDGQENFNCAKFNLIRNFVEKVTDTCWSSHTGRLYITVDTWHSKKVTVNYYPPEYYIKGYKMECVKSYQKEWDSNDSD